MTAKPMQSRDRRIAALEAVCAEAYQVIGAATERAGLFGDPATLRALDNLHAAAAGQPLPHQSMLPWPEVNPPADG